MESGTVLPVGMSAEELLRLAVLWNEHFDTKKLRFLLCDTTHGRIFRLLCDGKWHPASSIRLVAGDGERVQASEGLRRMRELRSRFGFTIMSKRIQKRGQREYALVPVRPKADPRQLDVWEVP